MSLHIRLNSKGGGGGGASSSGPTEGGGLSVAKSTGQNESVTVACPDHLILADLPVAKSIGVVTAASVRSVGRRSRRHLGERVHFCVTCDFPIAIYGRLSPCDHVFCLACARSEPSCYLCEERIQKITAVKLSEEIHICAAPHCLKSFTTKPEFIEHVHRNHANLVNSNAERGLQNDGNAPKQQSSAEAQKQPAQPEMSTARAPPPPVSAFSPGSNSQTQDREDGRNRQPQRPNSGWFPPPPSGPPPYHTDDGKPASSSMPPHQPVNYQMPQSPHFQMQFQGVQMGQGGVVQGYGGSMMNNGGSGVYFQGMGMGNGLAGKEPEQQGSGFGGGQVLHNGVLQPPLPRQPPPPVMMQQQQQQMQVDRGRDFPPGFGWSDQRGKTDN